MMEKDPIFVLVAPLDWGLGHVTRCIPIIKELIRRNVRVMVAANPSQKSLLKCEFPQIEFVEIPGYEVRYKSGILLKWALLFRIPSILKQIKKENTWLKKFLNQYPVDAVISDNRYGLYNHTCCCIFVTHQLQIQSGIGFSYNALHNQDAKRRQKNKSDFGGRRSLIANFINRRILKINYKFIEKFSACWVPDIHGESAIAGELSHPEYLPSVPVKYIGPLSRFQKSEKNFRKNTLLILLSGPEPQRTEFENILFHQLAHSTIDTIVVRGLPGSDVVIPHIRDGVQIWNHLSSDTLNEILNSAEYIIARSGYSTVMDLLTVKRNAIIVPTPGQTEQEYLGMYLQGKKWMCTVAQHNFTLETALNAFRNTEWLMPDIPDANLQEVIGQFVSQLSAQKAMQGPYDEV